MIACFKVVKLKVQLLGVLMILMEFYLERFLAIQDSKYIYYNLLYLIDSIIIIKLVILINLRAHH